MNEERRRVGATDGAGEQESEDWTEAEEWAAGGGETRNDEGRSERGGSRPREEERVPHVSDGSGVPP